MTINDKDKQLLEKFLSTPEIANAIDELAIDDVLSKMAVSNKPLTIGSSTMIRLYEELLQLIVDDVGGQYFIDNIKSNNKRVSLSSLSFDSPIVIRDDRFEFIFRFCEFNKGVTFDCETINLSALDMSIVYGNLVLTDKCKLIYNKALNVSDRSVCDIYIPKSVKRIGKLSPNAFTKNVRIIYEGSKNQFSQIDSNNLLVSDPRVDKFNLVFENK